MSASGSARRPIPRLPGDSFDRVLMVHMYHEIEQPYEFLWRLRPSLKPDGLVVVVDANRPTQRPRHAAGAARVRVRRGRLRAGVVRGSDAAAGGYLATFRTREGAAAASPTRSAPAA